MAVARCPGRNLRVQPGSKTGSTATGLRPAAAAAAATAAAAAAAASIQAVLPSTGADKAIVAVPAGSRSRDKSAGSTTAESRSSPCHRARAAVAVSGGWLSTSGAIWQRASAADVQESSRRDSGTVPTSAGSGAAVSAAGAASVSASAAASVPASAVPASGTASVQSAVPSSGIKLEKLTSGRDSSFPKNVDYRRRNIDVRAIVTVSIVNSKAATISSFKF